MVGLRIACPQCGQQLKLPDRSLLGRTGRCPRCRHSFVPSEHPANPLDEVGIQPVSRAQTTIGTSARKTLAPASGPQHGESVASSAADNLSEFTALEQVVAADDGLSRLREIKRRTSRRRNIGIVVGVVVTAALVGSYIAAKDYLARIEPRNTLVNPPVVRHESRGGQPDLTRNAAVTKFTALAHGQPISLLFVPTGASLIINVHPAALWKPGSRGERVRSGLGPLGPWADAVLRKYCLFDPSEIDEALICLILRAREAPAEVTVVVHLTREHKRSELLERFGGRRTDDYGHPVYVADSRVFLIADPKTFASAPKSMASEMVQARTHPALPAGNLDELLAHTDRRWELTVLFEPYDLRLYQDILFPKRTHRLLGTLVDWLGDNVEAVVWSLHLGPQFHSELLLRNKPITSPPRLERAIKRKLDKLPMEILAAVRKMNPDRKGPRKIIGRFPAMVQAYVLETTSGVHERTVQLRTVLHERAAPNLAVGTWLTWDESTRTDFGTAMDKPASSGPKLPSRLADRLKRKIDIDFRNTPLQNAFNYIAGETHVTIVIDGDALKLSGYTKNMPQTFTLGLVPATEAIFQIVKQYDDMTLILDEKKKVLTVMTKAVAADRKLKPFKVGP